MAALLKGAYAETGGGTPAIGPEAPPKDAPGVSIHIPETSSAGEKIRYLKGAEIYVKGRYGSVSMGSSTIDKLSGRYGLPRSETRRRILAYAYVYVNTFRHTCRGKTGYVSRKDFLKMDQREFDRTYGETADRLVAEQAKYNPPLPPEPPVDDVEPPDKHDTTVLGQLRNLIIRGLSILGFSFGENPSESLTGTEMQGMETDTGAPAGAEPPPQVDSPRNILD